MKAIVITRHGGPEVLEPREVAEPACAGCEVRIRVRATALNRADLLQRRGLYPAPPDAPADIPGLEFAGEIESLGPRATRFRPGDRVMGLLGGGGYAERVSVDESLCLPVPPELGWEAAAAVPEAYLTAFDALSLRGRLCAGEIVLLHAAASGVGTAAAQIAREEGAGVIGLSRSLDKRRRLQALGLDRVLDPASSEPGAEILRAAFEIRRELSESGGRAGAARRAPSPDESSRGGTRAGGPGRDEEESGERQLDEGDRDRDRTGAGVDLVIDLLGASSWPLDMEVLSTLGRLVLVGTMGGSKVEADLSLLMRKRLTVVGTVLRARPLAEKAALVGEFERRVLPLIASGRIAPIVDRVFSLREAAAAHASMERNENFGKIVLRVS